MILIHQRLYIEAEALRAITENRIEDFISMFQSSTIRVNSFLNERQPIHEVCIHGHEEFLKYLIDHGADLNILDSTQRTPTMICIEFGKWECLKILLTRGALYSMNIKYG